MRHLPAVRLLVGAAVAATSRGQAQPAPVPQAPNAFQVAVFGDMPYHSPGDATRDSVQRAYERVLSAISTAPVAFVVHIGDITRTECTDSVYDQRQREFSRMPHPLIYTFGDNEWTDCGGSGRDPLERLNRLRQVFTRGDTSLGHPSMRLERQSSDARFADYRENVRWSMGGVTFMTLHVVGSNNNRGTDTTAVPDEFQWRERANLAWLRDGFATATRAGSGAVAVFMQANPALNGPGTRFNNRPHPDGFGRLLDEFQRLAEAFGRPVALVHGDTHYFRVDFPFGNRATGLVNTRITRAETFGNPNFHALLMNVDPRRPGVFTFEPLVVR